MEAFSNAIRGGSTRALGTRLQWLLCIRAVEIGFHTGQARLQAGAADLTGI
jgi:hypothetical protein